MVTLSRDGRWPFTPFLVFRSIQVVFGLIVLALCGNIIDDIGGDVLKDIDDSMSWAAPMGVFVGLISMLWGATSIGLFFSSLLLPLVVVIIDAFCALFFLVTLAGLGDSDYMKARPKETFTTSGDLNSIDFLDGLFKRGVSKELKPYDIAKGALAMSVLSMVLFIATTAYASVILYRTRKDLRGRKYNAGLPAASDKEGAVDYVQPMQTIGGAPPAQPAAFDPNTGGYYQQTTSPVYTVATPPPQQVQVPGPTHQVPHQS